MFKNIVLFVFVVLSCAYGKYLDKPLFDIKNAVKEIEAKPANILDAITLKSQKAENSLDLNIEKHESNGNKCEKSNDVDGEINLDECKTKMNKDPALILTPYIEKSKNAEARRASAVDPTLFLGVESYSGFFTVNKTYNSNMFYWYFPAEEKPVNETPWIIWLQGGPGASSLTGLFEEIGPFKFNSKGLQRNEFSWSKNHSVLFIDNPVGTGFSFTNHHDGFARDMATYSKHLYSTVKQFLEVFPELRTAPLYIAGESYAGKYVPALGVELHRHKIISKIDVNLQGLMVGNAYIDPAMIRDVATPFYYFGLIDNENMKYIEPLIKSFQAAIDTNNSLLAKRRWMELVTTLLTLSHQAQGYNFLKDGLSLGAYSLFLNSAHIKKAIHVGDIRYSFVNVTVNQEMAPDFLSSSKELFEELLEYYRVMTYCGQLDQLLPCTSAAENHRTWQWRQRSDFISAPRRPIIYRNRLAGYFKEGGNLTEVVIRGAGHMAPLDQPARLLHAVRRWLAREPLAPARAAPADDKYVRSVLRNLTSLYV